ncbi:transporter family-2 protein [Ancylobacter sp. 3268]|uniref:DMT family transporter n=1 Tax=Ancylobacter sp. 3268 TaxID=2817752 RepID=UPI002860560E|nr:DMT family transporter [Ancylobacter sp. 3268]MDR6955697.1 transporter family-2 protein [Ancylobacter sp. 3268]
MNLILYVVVVAAGIAVAFQQVLNANLRADLGSPYWAGFVSYAVGSLAMVAVLLMTGSSMPSAAAINRTSWWSWSGGLFGAMFILAVIFAVPRVGAATTLALIVVGQMVGSLAFDHFGILGLPQQSVSLPRLAGAALLVAGVFLIQRS